MNLLVTNFGPIKWKDLLRYLQWAEGVSEHPAVVDRIARWVEIHRELKAEAPRSKRTARVNEAYVLRNHKLVIAGAVADR